MPDVVVGRDTELVAVERFLDSVRTDSAVLVLEGAAGIGKTTLWRAALEAAERRSYRVLSAQPAESERRLSYSALADLLGEAFDTVRDELPAPQQRGLDAALLRADATEATDPRTVATGLVSTLTALAGEGPVVVSVDDVQWLDRASERALEFAARRLPPRVGVLLARRTNGAAELPLRLSNGPADALERITIGPLSLAALHHVLRTRLGSSPPRPTLVRIEAASGGNPFYALEIARALGESTADRAVADPLPVSERLQGLLAARLGALSPKAREVALTASALSRPTIDTVLAAAGGEDARAALAEAEESGVLTVGRERIRFAHPLLAAAVYGLEPAQRRLELHRRLAELVRDPEERARQLAQGMTEPDETSSAELEEAATRASRRGAQDAAAELFEAASRLTPPDLPDDLARRLTGQAAALLAAGDVAGAESVAARAVQLLPPGPSRAEALFLAAEIAWLQTSVTSTDFLERALADAGHDRHLRGRIHAKLAAFSMLDHQQAVEHCDAAAALLNEEEDPGLLAYVLISRLFYGAQVGLGGPRELLARALELEERAGPDTEKSSLFLIWYVSTDDFEAARTRHELEDRWYRDRGEEGWQAEKRSHRAQAELRAGNWQLAEELAQESCDVLTQMGFRGAWTFPFAVKAVIDAHRGRVEDARLAIRPIVEEMEATGSAWFSALILEMHAFVELAAGDAASAAAAFERMEQHLETLNVVCPVAIRGDADHVEALVELGAVERALKVLERLEGRARMLPRRWTAATLPRCRALVAAAGGDVAEALAALEQASEVPELPFELARTLLAQGRLQRRLKQRRAAATSLRRSLALFEQLGAPRWAGQAHAELGRVGLRHSDGDELTATERRIAELAATGLTNREVAKAAFVSPKTVEANLARVYRKLGIASRAELGARMTPRP